MGKRRPGPLYITLILTGFLASLPAFAGYRVTGTFRYEDRVFDMDGFTGAVIPRPIRFADVLIVSGGGTLATGATDENGIFDIAVADSSARVISAVCMTSSTKTQGLQLNVRVAGDSYIPGAYYSVESATSGYASGSLAVNLGTTNASRNNDAGRAFNIWDVVIDGMQFVASSEAAGSWPGKRLNVIWRYDHADSGSFYSDDDTSPLLFIGDASAYNDTTITHEFGHFIDHQYFKSDSPGGTHYLGDDDQDIRLSWGEGLATFLGSSVRNFRGYDRPEIYVSTDGTYLSFSFELEQLNGSTTVASKTGSTNEVAVSAALWDITDSNTTADADPGIDDDPLERPFSDAWRVLHDYLPAITRPGISVESFWNGWFSPQIDNGYLSEMSAIFVTVNGIEFAEDAQEPDDSISTAPMPEVAQLPALASGAKVVINELQMGSSDAIELYNAGDTMADITGWTVKSSAPGYTTATFTVPAFKLPAGGTVVLSESYGINSSSTLYFGRNISWSNGAAGACVLRNGNGEAADFVRWGGSAELIPEETGFDEPDPDSPAEKKTLGRNYAGADSDSGADWSAQRSTFGTLNLSGLETHHTYYSSNDVGDVDYASLTATAGRSYLIETLNLYNGADTIVEVISSDGTRVLAANDDFGTSKASRLEWTAPSSGRYFIRSSRFSGQSNFAQYGSYDLRIIESSSAFGIPSPSLLTVSQLGSEGKYASLSDAVGAASNGDTIELLDSSTYFDNLDLSGKNITLKAAPGKNPVLNGGDAGYYPAIRISDAKMIRIEGITIAGGAIGIYITGGNVTVVNTVITGAWDSTGYSDGVEVIGSGTVASFINCTVANNGRLGIGAFERASVTIANTLFHNNGADDIESDGEETLLDVRNSLTRSERFAGSNDNFSGNPQFADSANSNFRLLSASAAIDKGDADVDNLPAVDADGIPRSLDGNGDGIARPDLGAFEYLPLDVLSSMAVIPQIAAGGPGFGYRTTIIAANTGSVSANAVISFITSSAQPFPVTILGNPEMDAQSIAAVQGGSLSALNVAVAPYGTARIEVGGNQNLTVGYAKILSSLPLNGTALFKAVNGDTVVSEAGAGLSKPGKSFSLYIGNRDNGQSGYALTNFGNNPANLILILRDSSGNEADARQPLTLAPGTHKSEFAAQRFPGIAGKEFEGSLQVTSDQEIAAMALRYENYNQDVFSNLPILADESATSLHFPQAVDGGDYRTTFVLMNSSANDADVHLEFFDDSGSPLRLPIAESPVSSYDMRVPAHGVASVSTLGSAAQMSVGWAKVTSPGVAIGGSAIIEASKKGRIASEAAITSFAPAAHFMTHVASLGHTQSGLAISNPNAKSAQVTLNLRDSAGLIQATAGFELPPLGHIARFFSGPGQWFPEGFDQFEGMLEVVSTEAICGAALRYENYAADVFATLPVIPIQ